MALIYIHIPFCKQACHYCDFHFSTSLKRKPELVETLCKELVLRKNEIKEPVKTIYLGGGTPSLLNLEELASIFDTVYENYDVADDPEITLEANPDDLTKEKIKQLAQSKINRLSIGIQSFFDEDLLWMNRSHNAKQALESVRFAKNYFDNLTIDLIYGVPGMSDEKWKENLRIMLDLKIPHVSCYALTVEPRTALAKMITLGKKKDVDDGVSKRQYEILVDTLTEAGYINYEFSNFGLEGYFSRNNMGYWSGKPYLGIGPSAHSFDGEHRSWNVRNNAKYITEIGAGNLPSKMETLTVTDRYNEHIMTHLRTMWGVRPIDILERFGEVYAGHFKTESEKLFEKGLLVSDGDRIHISKEGKFLGDAISSDLFYIE